MTCCPRSSAWLRSTDQAPDRPAADRPAPVALPRRRHAITVSEWLDTPARRQARDYCHGDSEILPATATFSNCRRAVAVQ